ncbi:hypothetical protein ACSHWB_26480 [Lentzea sp. HUAS TT2]|uniref:hypothetical protein n=1 Tax=Lentzea sp. HUAS TT2 TaxID=3447454 RepID=UPI003F730DA2
MKPGEVVARITWDHISRHTGENVAMNELEVVLQDLEKGLEASGDTRPLPELFELRMAAAATQEFLAAGDRGDAVAAEFHAAVLEHRTHRLRFRVATALHEGDQP